MNFKIEDCIILSANQSNQENSDATYLEIRTKDGGQFKMTAHKLSDVPILEKVNITGIVKGFVFGHGKNSRQVLDASTISIKPV